MKPILTILATAAAVAASVLALGAATNNPDRAKPSPTVASRANLVERGRYLVHRVGMCVDCHSPRDAKGEFIATQHLTGAPVSFAPTVAMPWTPTAPRIAGLPAGFTEHDTVHFLMTGERPNGRSAPLPPMPPYRFNRDDAEAIAAYLRSLSTGTP